MIVGLELNISEKRHIKKQLKKKNFEQVEQNGEDKIVNWVGEGCELGERDIDAFCFTTLLPPIKRMKAASNEPTPFGSMVVICLGEKNGKLYMYLYYGDDYVRKR